MHTVFDTPALPYPVGFPEGEIPNTTRLFRNGSEIPTACDVALQARRSRADVDQMVVYSVGCSYGAEADSVLHYLTVEASEESPIIMRGIDVYDPVVRLAKVGKYLTFPHLLEALPEISSQMPLFDVKPLPKEEKLPGVYVIDTNKLRERHDVGFIVADLSEDTPEDLPPADLILCNNLLRHIRVYPEYAATLVAAMAKQLKRGGILSTGSQPDYVARPSASFATQAGLEPILSSLRFFETAPFVFQKNAP